MEKVTGTEPTIEVFENDIDLYLHQFAEEQNIDDFRTMPQSVWNACLIYICRHVFKPYPGILKSHTKIVNDNCILPSNYNMYNFDIVEKILDYYIYLCTLYNKEISIVGFCNMTGIDTELIHVWGSNNNTNRLSTRGFDIYKKLSKMREESLSNKLADGKQNPVGVIAMLNRHYGWASPYTADSNKQKNAINAAELPRLGGNPAEVRQIAQRENEPETAPEA
ncbi:MAG: hypothetical protein J6Q48_01255 [Bacteroidaceae bacterium]|nr:hypothetical protein [Bacteroidaceae bacterium]